MTRDIQRSDLQIEAQQLSIADLFKSFYAVPDFQREYVWQPDDVQQLLGDICEELYDENGSVIVGAEYFIGSIVVYRDRDGIFQLIDGQQRTTTLFLILCVLSEQLRALETIQKLIRETRLNEHTFNEEQLFRVTLLYDDSAGALEHIATGNSAALDALSQSTSVRNLRAAHQAVRELLDERFASDAVAWKRFAVLFISQVKLIRVVTPSQRGALRVFETINNTGVGLSPIDLLKNLLFRKVRATDFDKVKKGWKELTGHIEMAKEDNPLRFLRYFVLSRFDTKTPKPLPEEQLYDWISDNAKVIGLDDAPATFLNKLIGDARVYGNLSQAKDPTGTPNRYLQNIRFLSGRAKQHCILLLAGQHLAPALFDRLCHALENLFFCFIVTREGTKVFEATFYKAALALRQLAPTDAAGLDTFLADWLQPEIDARAQRLQFALETLRIGSLQQYRIRYLMAKLTQYIDEQAWGSGATPDLGKYLDKQVHVEHILPETPTPQWKQEFDGSDRYDEYAARLGNLTLLEMSINTSLQQDFFGQKAAAYRKSNFLLTKTIPEPFQVGANTQPNRATAMLGSWTTWNVAAIEARQRMLVALAWQVWGITAPRTEPATRGATP